MMQQILRPLLGLGSLGVFACYPALTDLITQVASSNQLIDPEDAHNAFISAGEWGLLPDYRHWRWRKGSARTTDNSRLSTEIWGHRLSSPVGVAAGLDKNAQIIDPLFGLGYGFVEIGSVTPRPQEGNARPRVFRLAEDRAVINRYGFNSHGAEKVASRLSSYRARHPSTSTSGLLGVNLGKNKETEVASDDYILAMNALGEFADYLVINISSPNTAGLRSLQGSSEMEQLITRIQEAKLHNPLVKDKPLLVKIAPDLSPQELQDVATVSLKTKIDGLIVSNTTVSRPESLRSPHKAEVGGLSGRPLKSKSLQTLKDIRRLTNGQITLIAVGGVENGQDAYDRFKAGASLVQVYSAMAYEGPGLASRINDELNDLLERDGVDNISKLL